MGDIIFVKNAKRQNVRIRLFERIKHAVCAELTNQLLNFIKIAYVAMVTHLSAGNVVGLDINMWLLIQKHVHAVMN